ncbi:MAG: DUF971 domain-containing protein [Deltaproteobacteria bacterium]|nr:DUF971 domain-containing protein [Deltaproteobacteria bacterium]
MKPKEIKRTAAGVEILWSDNKCEVISYAWLRVNCSCAVCREIKLPQKFADVSNNQKKERIQIMDLVGNYALGITWGDGHRGIFAFERIRDHDLQPPPSAVNIKDFEKESRP